MEALKRKELINRLAQKGYTKTDSNQILTDVFDTITELLAEGETVMVRGFGTFTSRVRPGRIGANPQTGEIMNVAECVVPKFIAGKVLKRVVREGFVRK